MDFLPAILWTISLSLTVVMVVLLAGGITLTACNLPYDEPIPPITPTDPTILPPPQVLITPGPTPTRPTPPTEIAASPTVCSSSESAGGTAYITIDDGPGGYTSQVLDVLARYGVRATFFLVGNRIGDKGSTTRLEVERMRNEGHAIGIHSWSHTWGDAYDQLTQIENTRDKIAEVTGTAPVLFRAPGGDQVSADISGLYNYNWTVDTFDYKTSDPQVAANNIFQGVFDEGILSDESKREFTQAMAIDNKHWRNPIILMHSVHAVDPQALESIILGLQERCYGFGVLPRSGDTPGTITPITDGN